MKRKIINILLITLLIGTIFTTMSTVAAKNEKSNSEKLFPEYYVEIISYDRIDPLLIKVKTTPNIDRISIGLHYDENRDGTAEYMWPLGGRLTEPSEHMDGYDIYEYEYDGNFKFLEKVEVLVCGYIARDNRSYNLVAEDAKTFNVINSLQKTTNSFPLIHPILDLVLDFPLIGILLNLLKK